VSRGTADSGDSGWAAVKEEPADEADNSSKETAAPESENPSRESVVTAGDEEEEMEGGSAAEGAALDSFRSASGPLPILLPAKSARLDTPKRVSMGWSVLS
jgi:hypothetical protein